MLKLATLTQRSLEVCDSSGNCKVRGFTPVPKSKSDMYAVHIICVDRTVKMS